MNATTNAPTQKTGRPKAKNIKARQNISFDPIILKKGKKHAANIGLSLSAWIGQMIRAEIKKAKGGEA